MDFNYSHIAFYISLYTGTPVYVEQSLRNDAVASKHICILILNRYELSFQKGIAIHTLINMRMNLHQLYIIPLFIFCLLVGEDTTLLF